MKQLLILILMTTSLYMSAQPGIYSEQDIEFQTLYIEAQLAKYKGDTDVTIERLKEILKRDKSEHSAYNELAKTYLMLANYEQAEKNAIKACELKPSNQWYLLSLSQIYELSNQNGKAINTFKKLIANHSNPTNYHRLAMLLLKNGQPNEAATTLESLQALQGVDEETSRRIFDIYAKSDQEDKAVKTLQNLMTAVPENPRLLNNLASYYKQIGKEKEALKIYEQILDIDPSDPAATLAITKKNIVKENGSNSKDAEYPMSLMPIIENTNLPLDDKIKELMPLVASMKKNGEETNGLDKISTRLVELYPSEAKVYALRGDILFYKGQFAGSLEQYKKAIDLDDRKYSLWYQYLNNLWELSEYTQMAKVSEEAIDLYPNKVSAFLLHAVSLAKSDKAEALQYADEAKFIAGKNKILNDQVRLVKYWINNEATKEDLGTIDLLTFSDALYLELAGDLYASISDNEMAQKLWKQAINLGSNVGRYSNRIKVD